MIPKLSLNTQAILLLTAPLVIGGSSTSGSILSPKEYKSLAKRLQQLEQQPANLLEAGGDMLMRECSMIVDATRLQELLSRGFLLSQAIEQWRARSIWVISRADPEYPKRLKGRMRADAPPVLYGCGNLDLLETGGLAVVGPRKTHGYLIEYAKNVGELAAQTGVPVVSGGARGIDSAAMQGVIAAGGYGCEILAEDLFGAAVDRARRSAIMSKQLLILSSYDPNARFSVAHALQRNKLIYAMSDAALVVDSDIGRGGTWTGAVEQIEKLHYVPLFVRATEEPSLGLRELLNRGAYEWPEPLDHQSLSKLFDNLEKFAGASERAHHTNSLFDDSDVINQSQALTENLLKADPEREPSSKTEVPVNSIDIDAVGLATAPADVLLHTILNLLQKFEREVLLEDEVAQMLDVMPEQASRWLKRLEVNGILAHDECGNFRIVSTVKN